MDITVTAALITVTAGVAMGWINNVAGGAGVFAFWAFQYVCGLELSIANPSTRLGAVGVGVFAWLGFLRSGIRIPRRAWGMALCSVPGAFVGNLLALKANDLAFRVYLGSVLVLLLWRQLRRQPGDDAKPLAAWVGIPGSFLIGVHMGFAQIGTGFVAALVLLASYSRDFVQTNAAKSAIVIASSIASLTGFVLAPYVLEQQKPVIAWTPAICLALGTATGSFLASRWTVNKGSAVVRRVVLLIAALALLDQVVQIVRLLAAH